MPREQVHYEGTLVDLPQRVLPGGGWLEWDVTWRGPDGTRHPVLALSVSASDASVSAAHQGGRHWRLTVTSGASPAARQSPRMRIGRREPTAVVTAYGNVDGDLVPVARQEVVL